MSQTFHRNINILLAFRTSARCINRKIPLTCTTCSILCHTHFRALKTFFAKLLFSALFKCNSSLARQDALMLLFKKKKNYCCNRFLNWLLMDDTLSQTSQSSPLINLELLFEYQYSLLRWAGPFSLFSFSLVYRSWCH